MLLHARIATAAERNSLSWEAAASWAAHSEVPADAFQKNASVSQNKAQFQAKVSALNPSIPKAFVFANNATGRAKTEIVIHPIAPLTDMFQEQPDHEKATLIRLVSQKEKPLCDHYGVVVQERNLLTQNLLVKCQFLDKAKPPYYNNGFKIKNETKQQFLERMKRIRHMLNPYCNDDTIALFQELYVDSDITIDEVKDTLLGSENKERFNGYLDVGIYWGKNYTPSKAHPSRWKVVNDHDSACQKPDGTPQTMRCRYAQLQKGAEITNAYSFHGHFIKNDKEKENIKNTSELILKILKVCKGERVVIGGDLNLFVPDFAQYFQTKMPEIITHNVHIYYLKEYSTMSWHGRTFNTPYFNNLDCLIEALPI